LTNRFREHLCSDLRPYSCISQPCDDYDLLFETREKWIEHELQFHHAEWWCDVYHGDESKAPVFPSEESFTEHLIHDHDNAFTPAQVSFLAARGKRPTLFPFTLCPFCQTTELDLRDVATAFDINANENNLEKARELQKHIGIHLQNMAFLAFLDTEEEKENQDVDTENASRKSVSDILSFGNESDLGSTGSEIARIKQEDVDVEPRQKTFEDEDGSHAWPSDDENEVEWDFLSFSPIAPEDDPKLATFVERFKAERLRFAKGTLCIYLN
jgi:hypothetical protein